MKNTPYWGVFADVFNFMKAHYPPENTWDYWGAVNADALKICNKHPEQHELTKDLLLAIMKELEAKGGNNAKVQKLS